MLLKALAFANKKHKNQFRKGSKIPYITHPIEAMNILLENGYTNNQIIAGLLHDTIEDTDTTYSEIADEFSGKIADIVFYNTEDKSLSWWERKQHTLKQMRDEWDTLASPVLFSDKLANLRSIFRDIEAQGFDIWDKFNADIEDILYYYKRILEYSYRLQNKPMYHEYEKLYNFILAEYRKEQNMMDKHIIYENVKRARNILREKEIELYPLAFNILEHIFNRYNDPEACMHLGRCYVYGYGIAEDFNKGAEYLEYATILGDCEAPGELGICYVNGTSVQKDFNKALEMFILSRKRGAKYYEDAFYEKVKRNMKEMNYSIIV